MSYLIRNWAVVLPLLGIMAFQGCSAPDLGTAPAPAAAVPAIAASVAPTRLTLQQGDSADITVTVTRSGGFTGGVSFVVLSYGPLHSRVHDRQTTGLVTTAKISIRVPINYPPGPGDYFIVAVIPNDPGVAARRKSVDLTVTEATPAIEVLPGLESPERPVVNPRGPSR